MENPVNAKQIKELRKTIYALENECFSDMKNMISYRLMSGYAMKKQAKAYKLSQNTQISEKPDKTSDKSFAKDTIQSQTAEEYANRILKKMIKGKNLASKKLREFMIKNKLTKLEVNLLKSESIDGAMGTINKEDKSIGITLTAGIFLNGNEDILTSIIGHELGHFIIKDAYKSASINSREVESFCDCFGHALTASAGYAPKAKGELYLKFAKICPPSKETDPHPDLARRAALANVFATAYDKENTSYTEFPKYIKDIAWHKKSSIAPILTQKINKSIEY